MPIKILSDFDGVLTDLAQEAVRVADLFESKLAEESETSADIVHQWLDDARSAMRERPFHHGWKVKGRIAAFCNEDGFIRVNALGALLDERAVALAKPGDLAVKEALLRLQKRGISSFCTVAHESYLEMTRETARGDHNPIEASAVRALKLFLERGNEVVVVSNSGTDRIVQLLTGAGFTPEPHSSGKKSPLRVRGDAGKFLLGDSPDNLHIGEYSVDLDRPGYRQILAEERPNVVVGDVFSLDLALPLALRSRRTPGFEGLKVWLRKRDYTPSWSEDFLTDPNQEEVNGGVLEGLDELVALGLA